MVGRRGVVGAGVRVGMRVEAGGLVIVIVAEVAGRTVAWRLGEATLWKGGHSWHRRCASTGGEHHQTHNAEKK